MRDPSTARAFIEHDRPAHAATPVAVRRGAGRRGASAAL